MIASLVLFWLVSGFIALVISYDTAAGILSSHGFPPSLVAGVLFRDFNRGRDDVTVVAAHGRAA